MIFHMRESIKDYNSFSSPKLVYEEFKELGQADQESFWVLGVNAKNKAILKECLFVGGVSATEVDAKIIFRRLLMVGASGFICVHNHPSGDMKPSDCDIEQTNKLVEAARYLDLRFLDHMVVGDGYYSFKEHGLMK